MWHWRYMNEAPATGGRMADESIHSESRFVLELWIGRWGGKFVNADPALVPQHKSPSCIAINYKKKIYKHNLGACTVSFLLLTADLGQVAGFELGPNAGERVKNSPPMQWPHFKLGGLEKVFAHPQTNWKLKYMQVIPSSLFPPTLWDPQG